MPQALAFKILAPTEGQTVSAGDTIPVTIDVGRDTGLVEVRYYWYGEQDDTLVEQADTNSTGSIVATASLVSTAAGDPPYGGRLLVPVDGIGPMRLLAIGDISRGRLGGRSVFDELIV
ncbi:MAG TPA: Ig-like domain-containing protein, partial [Nitrospiraceae bacterium]|nr:Ig-like domain-containing protein [Nitrospiraceae bacterium]